jgi:hypothetical protein
MAEAWNSEHVISLFRFRMRDLTLARREEYSSTAERFAHARFRDARLYLIAPLHGR